MSAGRRQGLCYARPIIVPGIGLDGQAKLKDAGALIVCAGGLGSRFKTISPAANLV